MDAAELRRKLSLFSGTDNWHRHLSGLLFTDGVKFLADEAGAYWLLDLIGSYQKRCRRDPMLRDFQIWELKKTGNTARIGCLRDVNQPVLAQDIPFTDFPLDEITLYVENETILLPSER